MTSCPWLWAARASSTRIASDDIQFEKSTLPSQHSVIAIIKKQIEGQDHFLLRFNPYWRQYFFVGGRFETKYHTFENTLREEMDKKLHLKPEAYAADFVDQAKMIQDSDRDQKLKHDTFHLY